MKYGISLLVMMMGVLLVCGVVFSADEQGASDQSYERYQVIYQRNIFSKDRLPPSEDRSPRRVRTTQVLSIYVLRGVAVEGNDKVAFIEEQISGQTMKAQVGSEVMNGRIKAIQYDRVLYDQDGTEKYVKVGEEFGKTETTVMTAAPEEGAAPAETVDTEPTPATPSDDQGDILKRLMERRQSELGQ